MNFGRDDKFMVRSKFTARVKNRKKEEENQTGNLFLFEKRQQHKMNSHDDDNDPFR